MAGSRVLAFVIKEFKEALPPVLFFFISFNLVELTTQLILSDYMARLANFMIATATALIVGKAVLLADALPVLRWFDGAPLIRQILFKTVAYWAVVFVVRFLEELIEYLIGGGKFSGFPEYFTTHFAWHRFVAIQIWIFVSFLIYTFVVGLSERLGEGKLHGILFKRQAADSGPVSRR